MKKKPLIVFVLALMFFALLETMVSCKEDHGMKMGSLTYFLPNEKTIVIYDVYFNGDTVVHLENVQKMVLIIDSLHNVIAIKDMYFEVMAVNIDSIIQHDFPIK